MLGLASPLSWANVFAGVGVGLSQEMQQKLEKTIFLDLRDINVVDVFKFIAVQGNLNVVTSKSVQGRSTLLLKNVKILDALDILVISNQLAYEIRENIVYIMTEDEYLQTRGKSFNDKRKVLTRTLVYAKPTYVVTALQAVQSTLGKVVVDEDTGTVVMIDTAEKLLQMNALLDQLEYKLETQVVSLQYASAKDIEAQLKSSIDAKGVGSIMADERSNQIVLSAYPGRMESILPTVKALDKPTKAVLVEAQILQITLNPRYDFGINWEQLFKNHNGFDYKGAFPIDTSATGAATSFGKIAVGRLQDEDFVADIRFLKQVQNTKILANPRMMILNKEEAKINIGDRIPYVVTTSTGSGNNISISEDIRFIDVGINLIVTPVINDDGFITMKIRPEISSRTGTITTAGQQNEIPIVNTTYIETSVIVKDGVSIILGGLRRDDVTEDSKGVPYLMDIPLIGNAFKNRNDSVTRSEILVLITPRIVSGAKDVIDRPIAMKTESLSPERSVFLTAKEPASEKAEAFK